MSTDWTNEIIEACKRAGWYLQEKSRGLPGYYPSEAMRAFKDGYEAWKAAPPEAGAWQPIDTAPKDGTNVLLVNRKGNMATGLWQGSGASEGWWLRGGNEPNTFFNDHHGPTHWMPLPKAPRK